MKYHAKTVAFIVFIPLLLLIAVSFCVNGIISICVRYFNLKHFYTDGHAHIIITALIFIVLCFMAMMRYGYSAAKKIYCDPDNRTEIYLPLFIPVVWYLFWSAIMNVNDIKAVDLAGLLIQCIVAVNPFGYCVFDLFILLLPLDSLSAISSVINENHIMLLCSLLYYVFLFLGFAAGERLYVRKMGEGRKPFIRHKKGIIIFVTAVIAVYSLSEIVLYQHRKNIVSTAGTDHGFAYEGGYSSIDLQPYYVENEENILAKLDEPASFTIYDPLDMPVLDGAEAAYPVYSAFANACYANIADIQTYGKEQRKHGTVDEAYIIMPIKFNNTIRAYEKLLNGEVDIFFGAKPSEEQIQMADNYGKELILTPIGKEAFVFFVNGQNPVNGLSSGQIRDIYSGKIKDWRKVGGNKGKILAFQRPANSGSQTMMEYFMGDVPLRDPLEAEYVVSMGGVVRDVAAYDNGVASLGYSFRYYASIMMQDAENQENYNKQAESSMTEYDIKFLTIDGIYPDEKTIRSGEYPLTTELYAITVNDPNRSDDIYYKDTIEPFLEWMIGPQGQKIVEDTGYVSIE